MARDGKGGTTHTQRILNVDQPAVKAIELCNHSQLLCHSLVGFLSTCQECLADLPTICPLRDECPYSPGGKCQVTESAQFFASGGRETREPLGGNEETRKDMSCQNLEITLLHI